VNTGRQNILICSAPEPTVLHKIDLLADVESGTERALPPPEQSNRILHRAAFGAPGEGWMRGTAGFAPVALDDRR
jgi:hypothetical protein